jgi:Transposase DDE domain group 1
VTTAIEASVARGSACHDRVVAKVEFHVGELFPRVGFIVTNLSLPSRAVVRFYNKRGTAEQWIEEGKQATHWTRLSCHRFRANQARLQLSLLAVADGQSPHAAVVWELAAQDRGAFDAIGLATPIAVTKSGAEGGGSEKCLRNGFEKSNAGPWDFHVTAEKAMQPRTWLER